MAVAVFDVIGTPTQAEIAEIENAKLRRCIAMLEPKAAQPLNRRYPTMPDSYVTHHAATLPAPRPTYCCYEQQYRLRLRAARCALSS